MKKLVLLILSVVILYSCSSSVDTSTLTMGEHFDYAKKLFDDEDYTMAQKELQTLLVQYPGSAINDDCQYYLGLTHFKKSEYILAAYEFSKLIRDIPASQFVPDAQFMLAESYYQLSPPYQLDQKYSEKAIEEFQAFIDFFPTNSRVEEADKKINGMYKKLAEKEYNNAVIYEKMEYYYAALKYYKLVTEIYHDTEFAEPAMYKKIKIEAMKKMIYETETDIKKFIDKYPKSEYLNEVKSILADVKNK